MFGLFHAFACIPDVIIGMVTSPRATAAAILCGCALAYAVSTNGTPGDQPPRSTTNIDTPQDDTPQERRIVRALRWLLAKD